MEVLTKRSPPLPEGTRPYDLRHTFATLMLEQGENPKVVQEALGHSRIARTMDTYSHVSPNRPKGGLRQARREAQRDLMKRPPSAHYGQIAVKARSKPGKEEQLEGQKPRFCGAFLWRARQDSNLRPSDS